MKHPTIYLSPGLLLTMMERRQELHLTQLLGWARKTTPWRLEIVDVLNHGYQGTRVDLIADLAHRFDVSVSKVRNYLNELQRIGFLTDSPPAEHFVGQPAGAMGSAGSGPVAITTPVSLVCHNGHYLWYDHAGVLLERLTLQEVIAASIFAEPIAVDAARDLYISQQHDKGLEPAQFDGLVARMAGAGLLLAPPTPVKESAVPTYRIVDRAAVQALVDARVLAHEEQMASQGRNLVRVIPVNTEKGMAPAALGLLVAYAMEYDGGKLKDKFDFVPMFLTDLDRVVKMAATPGVFMFSNYVWNIEENIRLSAALKAVNPANITVHGGPSSPSYEGDCQKFFADNSHVDIVVRGEGELTFAVLLETLNAANLSNLEVLRDVPGLTYRTADGVCRTANRERITDLNSIPSPYLMGLFDEFGSVSAGAVIETNRGCPYGCTFCDWGSATLTKIRKFDLDRVYKELEWSAAHQIEGASIADANFGMLERDVAITEKIAELKRVYGFPRSVAINYAKNQVKYLRQIIEIMASVGILAEGVASLQTTDPVTLDVIARTNIKLDKYDELSTEFRRAGLPLAADIMMGLPGSTPESFKRDLQRCTDRDIKVRANPTQLLPNSPMNEPSYRERYGIVALPGEWVKETASYTRAQWDEMDGLRSAYYMFDAWGLLRYVARYVRRETGMGEVEFYDKVRSIADNAAQEWPVVSSTLRFLQGYMAPPGSWGLFIAEIRRYLVTHLGVADNSALRTVLAVQHAHIPAPGRLFPHVLELEHDYMAWQGLLLSVREQGHRDDWEDHVPPLSTFGPATLVINDPNDVCRQDIGKHRYFLDAQFRTWELESPVARPRLTEVAKAI